MVFKSYSICAIMICLYGLMSTFRHAEGSFYLIYGIIQICYNTIYGTNGLYILAFHGHVSKMYLFEILAEYLLANMLHKILGKYVKASMSS